MNKLVQYTNGGFSLDKDKKTVTVWNNSLLRNDEYVVEKVIAIHSEYPGAGFLRIYRDNNIRLYYSKNKTLKYYIETSLITDFITSVTKIIDSTYKKDKQD